MNNYVVAFDTANEMISLGIGLLDRAKKTIDCIASREVGAFRASNVKLLPEIESIKDSNGITMALRLRNPRWKIALLSAPCCAQPYRR